MKKVKRIFIIGNFKTDSPQGVRIERRRWPKGFIRLGHDALTFSYREVQNSYLPGRLFSKKTAKRKTDKKMAEKIRSYHPHLIYIVSLKYLDPESIEIIHKSAPGVPIVGRDVDPFPEYNVKRTELAKSLDVLVTSFYGRFFDHYKKMGVKCCAFLPNPCDPDIQRPYEVSENWKTNIVYTGKLSHERIPCDKDREDLIIKLNNREDSKIYGCLGNKQVDGIETYYAITGAKIALSVNVVNDVSMYHSDRLTNYLSCGTFTLAKRVPDTEVLFKDKEHLRYFDTNEEFFELAERYLKNDSERQQIAKKGMNFTHSNYNCKRMAEYLLELVNTGDIKAPWAKIS